MSPVFRQAAKVSSATKRLVSLLSSWRRLRCDVQRVQKNFIWLVVYLPIWKIWKSIGMMTFPIYGKIKNVPNHQPVNHFQTHCHLDSHQSKVWIFWMEKKHIKKKKHLLKVHQDHQGCLLAVAAVDFPLRLWWPWWRLQRPSLGIASQQLGYPLVMSTVCYGKWPLNAIEIVFFPLKMVDLSIVMLNDQRVIGKKTKK